MEIGGAPISVSKAASSGEAGAARDAASGSAGAGQDAAAVWQQFQAQYGAKAEKPRVAKKTLDKDDFLRIMVTQMKHQDPTSPFKAEQFAGELAQYASVEQLQNINKSMSKLGNQNQPLERLAMTNMIGKTVTVDRERFQHDEGSTEALSFNLSRDAENAKFVVVSELGEVVFEKDLGAVKSGSNTVSWDGTKGNTLPAPGGMYSFRVEAKDANGAAIPTDPKSQARVIGVSFEGSEAVFLVGDPKQPEKVTMKNIVRIDEGAQAIPGARSLAAAAAGAASGAGKSDSDNSGEEGFNPANPSHSFFSFKKGEGSGPLDTSKLSSESARALAGYQAAGAMAPQATGAQPGGAASGGAAQSAAATRPYADGERGFPNGLSGSGNANQLNAKGGE